MKPLCRVCLAPLLRLLVLSLPLLSVLGLRLRALGLPLSNLGGLADSFPAEPRAA